MQKLHISYNVTIFCFLQGTYEYLEHIYTDDQPEMHEYLAYWREHFDKKSEHSGKKLWVNCCLRCVHTEIDTNTETRTNKIATVPNDINVPVEYENSI